MKKSYLLASASLMISLSGKSQEKIIDTIQLYDNQLNNAEKTQLVKKITSDDILKNTTNISDVLRFQSPIYIKENGRGMVSSPSFRGTLAGHTAFIWNGININSITLGQGDINNLNLLSYNNISIKSGGGSVQYGSGAIGGSIHLNNGFSFNQGLRGNIFTEIGSFKTLNTALNTSYSNDKVSVEINANYSGSKNDYKIPEKTDDNINGKYYNQAFNINTTYKINPKNIISWISQFQEGLQHFPIFSITQIKTKYETNSFKSLLNWNYHSSKINNFLRTAYIEDEYGYFANITSPKTSGTKSQTYLVKNDFNYIFSKQIGLNIISEYRKDKSEGFNSGLKTPERDIFSIAGVLKYQPNHKFYIDAGVKKDFIEDISSPILFSLGASYKIKDWYEAKLNLSKNFLYPSFNDLYWQPGGNINLKPEISYQGELIQTFGKKNLNISFTPFYIRIYDLIRWFPSSAGYWTAINTNNVRSFGVESSANYTLSIKRHNFKANAGYIYTNSKDLDSNYQLMYTPFHKAFGGIDYEYLFFGIYAQGMYNGFTYTTSNEDKSTGIKPYFLLNTGVYFFHKNVKITFKINNIINQIYQTTAYYYMPKRNYLLNLNINL